MSMGNVYADCRMRIVGPNQHGKYGVITEIKNGYGWRPLLVLGYVFESKDAAETHIEDTIEGILADVPGSERT